MRLNPFKNIRLSFQLFALVAVSILIAAGLIAYAMQQVRNTQGTLKHTIDNRMVSGQAIQGVADALALSLEASLNVIEKKQTAQEAHDEIKAAMDQAHDDWDPYFLGEMIPEEQELADETTPLLDKAYGAIDKLLTKLESGELDNLAAWRNDTLRPALTDGTSNLKKLIAMQLTAANLDLEQDKSNYQHGAAQQHLPAGRRCAAGHGVRVDHHSRRDAQTGRGSRRGGAGGAPRGLRRSAVRNAAGPQR